MVVAVWVSGCDGDGMKMKKDREAILISLRWYVIKLSNYFIRKLR